MHIYLRIKYFILAIMLFDSYKMFSKIGVYEMSYDSKTMNIKTITPYDAKRLLIEGNIRYATGNVRKKDISNEKRQCLYKKGQFPFAVILCCSDSRVACEIVFDQGLGDLFVVRVAGNIADSIEIASVEYAVEALNTSLIVVMGHNKCGAVEAALSDEKPNGSIGLIVNKIKPFLQKVCLQGVSDELITERVENENIKNSVEELKKSPIIRKLLCEGKIEVLGAKYCMETGKVEFFDN